MTVDNDKVSRISQWLLSVESSAVKPQSNINILAERIVISTFKEIGNLLWDHNNIME